jgi:chromosome segregation ATPase
MAQESLRLASTICSGVEQQTVRLQGLLKAGKETADKRLAHEAQVASEMKAYDADMDECLAQLAELEREAEARKQSLHQAALDKEHEKSALQEVERIRKNVRQLEEQRDLLQSSITQKKQKVQEVAKSRQALLESRRNLKLENERLKASIQELELELQEKTGSIHCEMFDNTKNSQIIREGKFDFRKRLQEATTIEKKFEKAQENLGKDAKKLESRKSRLSTLREVNKTLHRRLQTKKELEQRYVDLTEQSLNLQFLISEVMRDLAQKFDIQNDEIEDVSPEDFVSGPKEIMTFQSQRIDELNNAIRGQNISNTKKKFENLVYH